jgi:hypothetical protein
LLLNFECSEKARQNSRVYKMNITHTYNYSGPVSQASAAVLCRFCEQANPTRLCIVCKQPVHNSDVCGVVESDERCCHFCVARRARGSKLQPNVEAYFCLFSLDRSFDAQLSLTRAVVAPSARAVVAPSAQRRRQVRANRFVANVLKRRASSVDRGHRPIEAQT